MFKDPYSKWRLNMKTNTETVSITNMAMPSKENTHDTLEAPLAAIPAGKSLEIFFNYPSAQTLVSEMQEWQATIISPEIKKSSTYDNSPKHDVPRKLSPPRLKAR